MRYLLGSVLVAVAVLGSGSIFAATPPPPATGLGQAWPNATDVSASPHYHVYVFQRSGVRYVQINDAAGTVRGAVALVDGEALDLPVGVDANRWTAVSKGSSAAARGEPVYRDDSVSILAAPQNDGTMRMMLQAECTDPGKCVKRDN